MLSYTSQDNFGQNNALEGNYMVKVTVVLMLGLLPGSPGLVMILATALALSGGNKLLRLNLTNAFLMGTKPKDYKFLRPSAYTSILYSLKSRYSYRFI
jgi:hypothetical protein